MFFCLNQFIVLQSRSLSLLLLNIFFSVNNFVKMWLDFFRGDVQVMFNKILLFKFYFYIIGWEMNSYLDINNVVNFVYVVAINVLNYWGMSYYGILLSFVFANMYFFINFSHVSLDLLECNYSKSNLYKEDG